MLPLGRLCFIFFLLCSCVKIRWASAAEPADSKRRHGSSDDNSSSGLSFKLFDNGALANTPKSTGVTETANLTLTDTGVECYLSGELVGTLSFAKSGIYQFNCQFFYTSTGWVWVDGHLVCQDNNCLLYTSPSPRDQRGSRMPSCA